jgi:hypothetical protein
MSCWAVCWFWGLASVSKLPVYGVMVAHCTDLATSYVFQKLIAALISKLGGAHDLAVMDLGADICDV